MEEKMKAILNELGTDIYDGKVIKWSNLSLKEIEEIEQKADQDEKEALEEINKLLSED